MERDRSREATLSADCVEAMEKLQNELIIAASCIARNALHDLELSIWNQEMLCAGLKRIVGAMAPSVADSRTRERLRDVARAIHKECECYASLVRECGNWNAALRDLCGLYRHARGLPKNTTVLSFSREA